MVKPGKAFAVISIFSIFIVLISAISWAEEQTYIVAFKDKPNVSFEAKVSSLGLSESGSTGEHLQSINAVITELTPQELALVEANPDVKYVVPDGVVATPEWWAGGLLGNEAGSDDAVTSASTPVEYYPWGAKRINAPAVHKMNPDRFKSAHQQLPVGVVLFALGLVGAGFAFAGRGRFWEASTSRISLSLIAVIFSFAALTSCTAVMVLPHVGILGSGVDIAILDTGIDMSHPDLEDNYKGGIDFVDNDQLPLDDSGHGTKVAGIVGAAENGQGIVGIAPEIGIWAVRTLQAGARGDVGRISDQIRGIEWAIERRVDIISMSFGTEEDNRALRDAVRIAHRANVIMVAAAGNQGGQQVQYPAAYPEVIAVTSSNEDDELAWFSNQGQAVEMIAPGTNLLTTDNSAPYWSRADGTSFSVPLVAGVAALVLSVGVDSANEVRDLVTDAADDLGLGMKAQGYGLLNAEKAVLAALER